jgi:hypothetical protein
MNAAWSRAGQRVANTHKKGTIDSRRPAVWGLKGGPLALILASIRFAKWVHDDDSHPRAPG